MHVPYRIYSKISAQSDVWRTKEGSRGNIGQGLQNGRCDYHKSGNIARPCAHVCFIPPKLSVSKVVGRIKGKSALMIFDRHPEYRERYNRHFWARGYYCETVGNVNEETIKKYIQEQYERDRMEGDSEK